MYYKGMGQTQTGFTKAYAQSLSPDYDLDLWPSNVVSVCHDDYLCQIIYKSHPAWQSYRTLYE